MGSIGSALGGLAGSAIGGSTGGKIGSALGGAIGGGGGGGGGGTTNFGGGLPFFNIGGVTAKKQAFDAGKLILKSSPLRQQLVEQLGVSFGEQGAALRDFIPGVQGFFGQGLGATEELLGQVKPGFGALTEARVNEVVNRGASSRSNLRANLARRRVLGSSFAEDVLGRFDQQLAQDVGAAKAQSFLEELDATNQLINQQLNFNVQNVELQRDFLSQAFAAERGGTQAQLDEQNILLEAGLSLLGKQADIINSNAQLEAQLAAQGAQQSGFGSGFGDIFSGSLSNIFGGGGGFNVSDFGGTLNTSATSGFGFGVDPFSSGVGFGAGGGFNA